MNVRPFIVAAALAVLHLAGYVPAVLSPTLVSRGCHLTTVDGPYKIHATAHSSVTCGQIRTVVDGYLSSPSSAGGAPADVGAWQCMFGPPGMCMSPRGVITFAHV